MTLSPETEAELQKDANETKAEMRKMTHEEAATLLVEFDKTAADLAARFPGDPEGFAKEFAVKIAPIATRWSAASYIQKAWDFQTQNGNIDGVAQEVIDTFVNGTQLPYEYFHGYIPAGILNRAKQAAQAKANTAKKVLRIAALAKRGQQLCSRCGGAGGWQGWPVYQCFRCHGSGIDPEPIKVTQ